VAGTRDLEVDPVLPLELDLTIVDPPRQQDEAADVQEIGLGERSGNLRGGANAGGHGRKIVPVQGRR